MSNVILILRFILLDLIARYVVIVSIMTCSDSGRHCVSGDLMGTLVTEKSCSIRCQVFDVGPYISVLAISARQRL